MKKTTKKSPTPAVTVIIPVGGHHGICVVDAVNSCFEADPAPKEVIVVDDCCDNLAPKDISKATLYRFKRHRGRSAARNFAATKAKTPWLFFLDADDVLEPTAIADFHKCCRKHPDVVYADYDFIDPSADKRVRVEQPPVPTKLRERRIYTYNPVNIGMFVKRQRYLDVGGMDEDMAIGEYRDFFLRYTANPKVIIEKHDRPFFVAGAQTSVLKDAGPLMTMASQKIMALIRGGYYWRWIDV